ncbi:hypothetical protein CEP51_015806 [Fusarium floridanum]|uniref:Protein kinase domain-containing protein n=1 Tax=Fusarium floridanum TaxID=1325733 RepID=A0A428P2G4_9HYPO|nr:hypothetical protein CEP51_015806 [Fusarium floridanum]
MSLCNIHNLFPPMSPWVTAMLQKLRKNPRVLDDWAEQITCKMKKNPDEQQFLPCDQIDLLVNKTNVAWALRAAGLRNTGPLVTFVLQDAKRLFLILVLMSTKTTEKLSLIAELQDIGLKDAVLPLSFDPVDNDGHGYSRVAGPSAESARTRVDLPTNWERGDRENFRTYQWRVMAPIFDGSTFRFEFHPHTVMPYLGQPAKRANSGFFGEVSRFEIHSAHIPALVKDHGEQTVSVAVKKAKDPDELQDFFNKEAENLAQLRNHTLPNLIKPIAAYEKNGDRCLIFPWAAGGTLSDYWETKNTPSNLLQQPSLKWILSQFTGICCALKELHTINCRHGDLKPDNILWFKDDNDRGTLKIADLGLAAFHKNLQTIDRRREGIQTKTPSGTRRYEPPETDENRNTTEPRSRTYDIWSMGCIILELLIWLVYGFTTVDSFQIHTEFFWEIRSSPGPSSRQYVVHHIVQDCIKELERVLKNDSAYKALLDLVKDRLLVVLVSDKMTGSSRARSDADNLCEMMKDIQSKLDDSGFLQPV